MKIAVIGAGISGLGAAWMLNTRHDVTLYEAGAMPGGHAHTVNVEVAGGRVPVDTGFIVYNEHNYPNLTRLFAALGVTTTASDMSFAASIGDGALEYAGSPTGFLAQPSNLLRSGYWRMLRDLVRFCREAPRLLSTLTEEEPSLADLLRHGGYSEAFARWHLLPMAAAIWSSAPAEILNFPARTFVRFFENHGLLSLGERPAWRSVLGGSRSYVSAMVAPLGERLRLATPVAAIRRSAQGVTVTDGKGAEECYDQLVLATHADQALALLAASALPRERAVLGAFRYQDNHAILHADRRLMPRRRRIWASWNYIADETEDDGRQLAVSYWMNRLQKLDTSRDLFVTLNPYREPDPEQVFGRYSYRHPQFDRPALQAQTALSTIQGLDRIWFCGSYCGYGFHEDGLQAGLGVAAALGAPAPWAGEITPMSPAFNATRPLAPAVAA